MRLSKVGKRTKSSTIILIKAESKFENTRIGYTVSKKVGNAVVRNLVKRRLRSISRMLEEQIPPNIEVVIIAKQESAKASFEVLKRDFKYCLTKF